MEDKAFQYFRDCQSGRFSRILLISFCMARIALAVHGGAGTILRSAMTAELEREYRSGLETALKKGWQILEQGGSSLDAVEEAVCRLEDFELFNAGRGSVFTHEGKNEMDASIMDGRKLRGGAVAFVKNVKNPIKLARLVMERTDHVLLGGAGANQFALEMGVEMADDAYFYTQHRYEQLLKAREEGVVQLDHTADEQEMIEEAAGSLAAANTKSQIRNPKPIGTVGAVACDSTGDLAAATSTGGMTNKKFGRIGDTPLIGSGTYADNATCAISCTGHGEFFMEGVTAYDVAARMKYQMVSLENAARETIESLTRIGGEGGLIAVDGKGNITMPFNSEGMYRGCVSPDGETSVAIYS
jgi:beta-aspartyl-peptidase (threonine type)